MVAVGLVRPATVTRVVQATTDSVNRLRDGWQRQWLRDSAGAPSQRAAMLDLHAVLHAASQLLASSVEPVVAPRADLEELLLVHDELGRRAASGLAGEVVLAAGVVQRVVLASRPVGVVVPVQAAAGDEPLKAERSRPGWHLNGAARGVAWHPEAQQLAVFATDEGANDLVVLVDVDTPRVEITVSPATGSGRQQVDICFDDVPVSAVAHCPGESAALADGLTVLTMADVIGAAGWLLEPRHGVTWADARQRSELQLCRATLRTAAAALTSSSTVRRQHDVSAATLLVLPTCLRLAETAPDQDDPEVASRVQRIREQVLELPQWHRDRLVALV